MKIHTMIQYSPLWWEARAGHVTASNADRIITAAKGEPSTQQEAYIDEIISEMVVGPLPTFFTEQPMSPAMRHGRDTEPEARRWYNQYAGLDVQMVGGVESDDGLLWASPDGLIRGDGVLELKCPTPATHFGYLRRGGLPVAYRPQCHMHLLITGRSYVEFVSYCPKAPTFVVRLVPDEYTQKLADALAAFLERLAAAKAKVLGGV
jgi:hypothetical protein